MYTLLLILFTCTLGVQSYSSPLFNSFYVEKKKIPHSFNNNYINYDIFEKIYELISQKESYCYLSTIANDEQILNHPVGTVLPYAVNTYGLPLLSISDKTRQFNYIENNNAVSLLINKKGSPTKERIVLTGTLKKIKNDFKDGSIVPSKDTLIYKNLFTKFHKQSLWIDYPEYHMFILNNIKNILYVSEKNEQKTISIKNYVKYFLQYHINY
jgi:hypothetical protein